MKPHSKAFVIAAILLAYTGVSRAQVQTYQTVQPAPGVSGFSGVVSSFNGTTRATQGQIFSNVLAIESMTYNLFTTGSPSATNLFATLGQWDVSNNVFTGPTVDLGTFLVPTISGWDTINIGGDDILTFEIELDIATINGGLYMTNPNLSYAVMLTQIEGFGTAGSRGFGIGRTDSEGDFDFGIGSFVSNTGVFTQAFQDFTFTQISVEPGPVPEASTVAALLGAAFVAGLVGLRLRQRRQLIAAPAAA